MSTQAAPPAVEKERDADERTTESTSRPASSGSGREVHHPRVDAGAKPQSTEQPRPPEISGNDSPRSVDAEAELLLRAEERLQRKRVQLARQRAAGGPPPLVVSDVEPAIGSGASCGGPEVRQAIERQATARQVEAEAPPAPAPSPRAPRAPRPAPRASTSPAPGSPGAAAVERQGAPSSLPYQLSFTEETEETDRASIQVRGNVDSSSVSSVKEEKETGEAQDVDRLRSLLSRAAQRSAKEVSRYRDSSLQKDYRSPALLFARVLRSLPEFKALDAEAATARIDAELGSMFPAADFPAPWVALGLPDVDSRGEPSDPRSDFLALWDSITTVFDLLTPVDVAAQRAEIEPVPFGQEFSQPADSTFRQVVSLCFWLGKAHPERECFVSYRDLARALHLGSHVAAGQLLKRAEKTGFLVPSPYGEEERRNRRAKRWRFAFSRVIVS